MIRKNIVSVEKKLFESVSLANSQDMWPHQNLSSIIATALFSFTFLCGFIGNSIIIVTIVEFRIPGYPGPSKERGTKARLMRGKIFRGKIRMYLQLHVVHSYDF